MSPTLFETREEGSQGNVGTMELKERNYMGLSDCSSSVDSSVVSDEIKACLNMKATELRLGLPGSQSPERGSKFDEKPFFPLLPSDIGLEPCLNSTVVSGNKRGFFDAMDSSSEGKFLSHSEVTAKDKAIVVPETVQERPYAANRTKQDHNGSSAHGNCSAPVSKAQVVGWPPIRSFRKNTLSTASSKNTEEVNMKSGPGAIFVKVSMDGAPYLRKVDLQNYYAYQELSSALEKMFGCFTIGAYGSHGASGREKLSESKLRDLLHGSEYVLTYKDKDDDWMLVGDVPWEMFIDTCRRMRIMKSSDAIGLAPRAVEKSKHWK